MKKEAGKTKSRSSVASLAAGQDPPPIRIGKDNVRYLRVGEAWIPVSPMEASLENGALRIHKGKRFDHSSVEIPADLEEAICREADRIHERYKWVREQAPNAEWAVEEVKWVAWRAIETGFYLALLRYADHLKTSVEATAILEHRRQTAQKNGKARTKKVAPTHKAIQKRFRELRKTCPKKTARYLRVAEEFGMSDRHVARIVDGLD
jgi:hypothetical protein